MDGVSSPFYYENKKYNSVNLNVSDAPRGYENQWMLNPYAQFDYKHSWWQRLWEGLGFRSQFDAYRESMANNAREYQAQLLDKAHNEEYDSPMAQAQRERAAGINPDLAGIGPGESSPMVNDPNGAIVPSSDDPIQVFTGFGNMIMSAFTGGLGIAKDILSLGVIRNDVNAGKIDNSRNIVDFALNSAVNFIPGSYDPEDPDLLNRASGLASDIVGMSLSSKQRKQFRSAISSFLSSAPSSAKNWESWKRNIENKRDFFISSGSEFNASDEVLSIITDELSILSDEIFKNSFKLQSQELDVQSQELGNRSEYLSNVDPSLAAGSENASNEATMFQRDINAMLSKSAHRMISRLSKLSDQGGLVGSVASAVMLFIQVLMLGNMSKVSFNSNSSYNSAKNIIQN